jgi:cyclopropane-fatty-acyl-phospholipid synthase
MLHNRMIKQVEQRLRGQKLPLTVELWNGKTVHPPEPAKVKLRVRTPRALLSLAKPSMGKLASQYVEQEIDLEGNARDIIKLGEALCNAAGSIERKNGIDLKWWRHSRKADRRAVSYHYDVSNEFYALWLDRRRVYSCAYFKTPGDGLDIAQEQKLDHICRKLLLQPDEHLLDIGCGWGGLILWAAENYGVRATGITLSRNQHDYAQQQIRERGLEKRVEVRLMDYRDLPETAHFDKIASVGMFEHVGRKNLAVYFAKIFRLLRPGGLVMNHGITTTALDTEGLGSGISDFIDRYVFPDGELTHVSRVVEAMAQQKLECLDSECLRPHYARTLWHWVERLEEKQEEARRLVGEDRFRIWQIYMAGSAHAFERGWLSLYQLLAAKPHLNGTVDYPLTREHVYGG